MPHDRSEIELAVSRYCDLRRRIEDPGEAASWADLADLFTEDAVYIDPAWGRIEGREEIRAFMHDSMVGLDDWRFPIEFTAIEGDDVVIKWTQILPGTDATGGVRTQSGFSRLIYAGDGRFRYEEDLLNMTHVMEDLAATGFQVPAGFHFPPAEPDRDVSIEPRRAG